MALTPNELGEARKACFTDCQKRSETNYPKPAINAALDALDDQWERSEASLNTLIDSAGAFRFSDAQKKTIKREWLRIRVGKE